MRREANACQWHIAVGLEGGLAGLSKGHEVSVAVRMFGKRAQNTAIPVKHQIELVASFRSVTEMGKLP